MNDLIPYTRIKDAQWQEVRATSPNRATTILHLAKPKRTIRRSVTILDPRQPTLSLIRDL